VTTLSTLDVEHIRVLLADDHCMITDMFQMFLANTAGMQVDIATSFDEAAQILHREGSFDVVLLDLNMPGMNGLDGLKQALKLNKGKPVAILTGMTTPRMSRDIMDAGAAGIILKTTPLRSLANSIRFMHSGERYLPMELIKAQGRDDNASRPGNLSNKEMDVLSHLAEGKSNKEIAKALGLAEATVKMHVNSICRKIGANNRTRAVLLSQEIGLI